MASIAAIFRKEGKAAALVWLVFLLLLAALITLRIILVRHSRPTASEREAKDQASIATYRTLFDRVWSAEPHLRGKDRQWVEDYLHLGPVVSTERESPGDRILITYLTDASVGRTAVIGYRKDVYAGLTLYGPWLPVAAPAVPFGSIMHGMDSIIKWGCPPAFWVMFFLLLFAKGVRWRFWLMNITLALALIYGDSSGDA